MEYLIKFKVFNARTLVLIVILIFEFLFVESTSIDHTHPREEIA